MEAKMTLESNQTELKNGRQDGVSMSRLILFVIAVVAIFTVWGMRVYADNSYTIEQGKSVEINFDSAISLTSPDIGLEKKLNLKAHKEGSAWTEMSDKITITGKDSSESNSSTCVDKINITVAADAPV